MSAKSELLTQTEAAAYMGCTVRTVYTMTKDERLPCVWEGVKRYYRVSDCDAVIATTQRNGNAGVIGGTK